MTHPTLFSRLANSCFPAMLLALSVAAAPVMAGGQQDLYTVGQHSLLSGKDAFRVRLSQAEGGHLKLSLSVAPGYYLYRDKINISVEGGKLGHVELPPAVIKEHPLLAGEYVYEGQVALDIERLILEQGRDAKIHVKVQGCHPVAGVCYPPQSYVFEIRNTFILGNRPS